MSYEQVWETLKELFIKDVIESAYQSKTPSFVNNLENSLILKRI